jgi:hypothetical protein
MRCNRFAEPAEMQSSGLLPRPGEGTYVEGWVEQAWKVLTGLGIRAEAMVPEHGLTDKSVFVDLLSIPRPDRLNLEREPAG